MVLRVPSFATTRRYFVPFGDVNITPDACDVPTFTSPVNVDIPVTLTLPLTVSAASAVVVPIPTLLVVLIPVLFDCHTVRLLKTPAFASTH